MSDSKEINEKAPRLSQSRSTLRPHETENSIAKPGHDEASIREKEHSHSPSISPTVSHVSSVYDEEAHRPPSTTADSRPISVRTVKRRGCLSSFVILPEVQDPMEDYPVRTKWIITVIIAIAGSVAPLGSSIIFPSLDNITEDLHTTTSTTTFSVGVYMLALGIFPLFWSSFCETLGRRPIYIVSFTLMILFNILAALSNSIAMFIVTRLLAGGSAASVQSVGAGTLADIWHVKERGKAMGYFYLGPLCGPLLAPIIGGLLQTRWQWRSTMWFMTIVAVVGWNLLFWCLPETLKETRSIMAEIRGEYAIKATPTSLDARPALTRTSTRQSVKEEGKIYGKLLKRLFIQPFTIIKYLRFPAVTLTIYYASITFGCLYLLQISVQVTFSRPPYNFSPLQIGLSYISNSVGYIVASVIGGPWVDKIMAREARKANRYDEKGELVYRPEDRMRENAWLAAILFPCAMIWYGWTAEKGVFYVVPLVANFFFGVGSMLLFAMITTMLTEFMPNKASTGIALNNLVRSLFSFVGSVVAEPLVNAIGDGWLFTGVGVIALASSSVIWAMRYYGPKWRKTMDEKMD